MIVTQIETFRVSVPLIKPFKTALRTVTTAESVVLKITCDNGITGWGEAPPTAVITGDMIASIETAIHDYLKPYLLGKNLLNYELVFQSLHKLLKRNSSSLAAMDMAIYDCLAQNSQLPLYQYLGGYRNQLETDFTVSVNEPTEMADDASRYLSDGFHTLKIKVGIGEIETDIERVKEVRRRVGNSVTIRLDANQGWKPKEAVSAIRKMEDMGLNIELVEQPVIAHDLKGLKQVTDHVDTLIMADESVFTPTDVLNVIQTRSADLMNLKLMKSGGIYQAEKMNSLAESAGIECMVGSMIETHIGITAAAHFAASKKNITRFDFDAPLMLSEKIIDGGVMYKGNMITFSDGNGLGIKSIHVNKGECLHGEQR